MANRNEWEPPVDLDETVRNLKAFTVEPGELGFRQSVANGFEGVNGRLGKIDVRLARMEERQLSRATVAEIAKKEIEVLESKVETLNRVVWGMAGAVSTAIIVLAVAKVFGK